MRSTNRKTEFLAPSSFDAKSKLARLLGACLFVLLAFLAISCGGGGGGGGTTTNPVTISVTPTNGSVEVGKTLQFTAVIHNATSQTVVWSVTAGTITSAGQYTPPSTAGIYTVTATSAADSTLSTSVPVGVTTTPTTVKVTLDQSNVTLSPNGTHQFTATVTGSATTTVIWAASAGTITQTGLFTAPSAVGPVTVVATSTADSTASASAVVSVVNSGPIVTLDAHPSTIGTNETYQFVGHVANSTNTGIVWTASSGSVDNTGLYQAPLTAGTYTITATSAADSTRSVSTPITVNKVVLTLAPKAVTLAYGGTQAFLVNVGGPQNKTVVWSATGGTIDQKGNYTTPSTAGTYFVTATSQVDPSASQTATVTDTGATNITYTFDHTVPSEWNPTSLTTSPSGVSFLGPLDTTKSATLTLTGLTPHKSITLSFDLYLIGGWDGTTTDSQFTVTYNSNSVFSKTFSNIVNDNQTYPNGVSVAPGTGATATNSLGYTFTPNFLYNDATYHISIPITDTSTSLSAVFAADITKLAAVQSWGLKNVQIVANP